MQNTYTAGGLGVLYEKSIFSTTTSLKSPFPVQKNALFFFSPSAKKRQKFFAPSARAMFCMLCTHPAGGGRAIKRNAKHAKHVSNTHPGHQDYAKFFFGLPPPAACKKIIIQNYFFWHRHPILKGLRAAIQNWPKTFFLFFFSDQKKNWASGFC